MSPAAAALPALVRSVIVAMSPLIAASAGFWLLAGVVGTDAWLFDLAGQVSVFLLAGVLASYLVHETAHLAALALCPGIHRIDVQCTYWRFSLVPEGEMDARAALLVALAGPGTCLLIGSLLLVIDPFPGIAWCYLAHVVFLLPVFGDGRTALSSARHLFAQTRSS